MNKPPIPYDYKLNSFDILRYLAAFNVMFLHFTFYAIYNAEKTPYFIFILRKYTEAVQGVVILFTISGFLMAASLKHTQKLSIYFKKRALRLYPELWFATIFSFILLVLLKPVKIDATIFKWLLIQSAGVAYTPAPLKSFATGSVNGALWTVMVEIQLYILIAFFYKFLQKLSLRSWSCLLAILFFINLLCGYINFTSNHFLIKKLIERSAFPYMLWFFIGSFSFFFLDMLLPLFKKTFIPVVCIYILLFSIPGLMIGYYVEWFTNLLLPWMTLCVAFLLPPIRLKWDLSYELFLSHWIVLNIIIHYQLFQFWNLHLVILFFIILTFVISIVLFNLNHFIQNKIRSSNFL